MHENDDAGPVTGQARTIPAYRALWVWLSLGWMASAVDRTVTGPVVSYMIENKVPILEGVENPYAAGGLIGSMLFAGYMLMQFPGGHVGGRRGHRTVIVISILWAGLATVLSGLFTALLGLVAMRLLTGLGAGLFYSNDRSVITNQTPFEKRSLGMGVAITGLSIGITLAYLLVTPLISFGTAVFGSSGAWRMPFLVLGVGTAIIAFGLSRFFNGQTGEHRFSPAYLPAMKDLGKYSVVFFVVALVIYFFALRVGLPEWAVAVLLLAVALLLVLFIFARLGNEIAPVLYNRDLLLIYLSFIAVLWNLWFFGFWSISIVSDAAGGSSLLKAALTAVFFGVAGIVGFPIGGWLADYAKGRGWGRKGMLVSFTLVQGLLTVVFGLYILGGGHSLLVLGMLLFTASLFFNALQPMSHALTSDLTPSAGLLGAAFGMENLFGEMGAVLSPAISGVLRGATGSWTAAVLLDAGVILVSFVLLLFVREPKHSSRTAG